MPPTACPPLQELGRRVKELERENDEYRKAGKAHEFEERIQVG